MAKITVAVGIERAEVTMHKSARLVGLFAVLLVGCQEQSDPAQGLSPEPGIAGVNHRHVVG